MADGSLLKVCPICKRAKSHSEFRTLNSRRRVMSYCRPCEADYKREHYKKNADLYKARVRAWKKANPERKKALDKARQSRPDVREANRARHAAYRKANAEKRKETYTRSYYKNKAKRDAASKAWMERNPIWVRERGRRLKIMRKRAEVAWADPAAMREFYAEAARLTLITGIIHEVDHIVPIAGENVCGLHCESNLQVVPRIVNRRKRNFFNE